MDATTTQRPPLVMRLGEACHEGPDSHVGRMERLAHAGLPTPKGVVLTREAHRRFLLRDGLLRKILEPGTGEVRRLVSAIRRVHLARPLDGGLGRLIGSVTLRLEARTVAVSTRRGSEGGLGTVPAVLSAVRGAWLHGAGLGQQISAARVGEEVPLWPVLIQREPYPKYTAWSASGEHPILHDIGSSATEGPGYESLADLTSRAADILGEPVRLQWGLEAGRWYLLSVERYGEGG